MNKKKSKICYVMARIIMFISSYCPLYILILILHKSKLPKNTTTAIVVLILISIISLFIFLRGKGTKVTVINNLENPDDTVLSYIMTYLIPLINNGDNLKEMYIVNSFLFLLIGYVYIRLNLIYLNPLWAIFGYLIYRNDNREIIITNISRQALRQKKRIKGYYISNDIFIANKKYNLNSDD